MAELIKLKGIDRSKKDDKAQSVFSPPLDSQYPTPTTGVALKSLPSQKNSRNCSIESFPSVHPSGATPSDDESSSN